MSPRPSPQPVTRAARPSHPLAREAASTPSEPTAPGAPGAGASSADQGPAVEPATTHAEHGDRSAGQPADQQTSRLAGRQRSERRQDAVFSTRVPAEVKTRLRRYAFEHDLLVQDIVTDLLQAYLAEHDR